MSLVALHAAVAGAVRVGLGDGVTAVFEVAPVRSAYPYALVVEVGAADWSTKDAEGIEARLAVELHDGGEDGARCRSLAERARGAVLGLSPDLAGWWIGSVAFVRQRVVRTKGEWVASVEFRVRMLRGGSDDREG